MTDQNLILEGLLRLSPKGHELSRHALELYPGRSIDVWVERLHSTSVAQKITLFDDMRQNIAETERQIALLQEALGVESGS